MKSEYEFYSKVAGGSFRNDNGADRQKLIRSHARSGSILVLKREPDNRHSPDGTAISVWLSSPEVQIGYINDDVSHELASIIDGGSSVTAWITEITGGTHDKPTAGVNVRIKVDRRQQMAKKEAERELKRKTASDRLSDREAAREEKRKHLADQARDVQRLNDDLLEHEAEWHGLLAHALEVDDRISFDSLRARDEFPALVLPSDVTVQSSSPKSRVCASLTLLSGSFQAIKKGSRVRFKMQRNNIK